MQPLSAVIESGFLFQKPHGTFVLYACRSCGFAEWYVAEVSRIPTDLPGVELLEGPPVPPKTGPFR